MTRRLVLAGAALGSAGLVLSAGRVWATASVRIPALGVRPARLTGHDLGVQSTAAVLLALAGIVVAVTVARPLLRRAGGGLLALGGVVALTSALAADGQVPATARADLPGATGAPVGAQMSAWPVLAVLAGALLLVAGGLAVAAAGRWSGLGRRYDAASAPRPATESDLWHALDRGEDPTG